ncbi:gamma-glutamylcyclotransferase [Mesorhizobium sp. M0152]|uniref:gamma-glutamylcyclotransferase family protein n=1 Tax=Mesorhizobium sp. M0152 TaxID=2956898 RepID=UPI00333A60FB
MLYFAYGSNLNIDQMAARCPCARPVGPFDLVDHELVFRGVADIVAKPGARVAGGLWRITEECEKALDRYEGVASELYRKEFVTVEVDGCEERALVYMMNRTSVFPPSSDYLSTIAEGFRDFGIAIETLKDAVLRSVSGTWVSPRSPRKKTRPASNSPRTACT